MLGLACFEHDRVILVSAQSSSPRWVQSWQRTWTAQWSHHEVGGRTLAGDGGCGCMPGQPRRMWSADLQRTDVTSFLCTSFLSQGPPRQPCLCCFISSSTSAFKGTCHDRGWAAFFRCAGIGCRSSLFAQWSCCLTLRCSLSLGLHYSQHTCIESSVKLFFLLELLKQNDGLLGIFSV
jgi:hypothetical protein